VALDFSLNRTGVMIGLKMENAIRIPSDYDGVLFFRVDSTDLNIMQVFLRENNSEREGF
jgi:predicted nucleotide-binding protein